MSDNPLEKRYAQFRKLLQMEQPEQRSQEWYDMRNNMITASNIGSCLGLDKYKSRNEVLKGKCLGNTFTENPFVYHGKKYEQVANLIYQHMYNIYVQEFGLIQCEEKDFIGASPDGIASNQTFEEYIANGMELNVQEEPASWHSMVGRMLEIKCPLRRKINIKGEIKDNICPMGYWCQVQTQLYVCGLDECDFFQCSIEEYNNYTDYLLDDCADTKVYVGKSGREVKIPDYCKKGIILEFVKASSRDSASVWDREPLHIYPPTLRDTPFNIIPNNIDLAEYKFHRILYWKLNLASNVTIKRDDAWIAEALPEIELFWKDVLHYRENNEALMKKVGRRRVSKVAPLPPIEIEELQEVEETTDNSYQHIMTYFSMKTGSKSFKVPD